MMAHSLRPHSMEGHMHIYKYVLHHSANKVPKWFLEALGVYVSQLNGCAYCVDHHFEGLVRLLDDRSRADTMRAALEEERPEQVFEGSELAAMRYAWVLTRDPSSISPCAKPAWTTDVS